MSRKEKKLGELFERPSRRNLIKFGLIPEFIGRLPIVSALHELDEASLVRVLTEPKNALTKQYQKYFEMENVKLKFTPEALKAVALEAIQRQSGARGLRAILAPDWRWIASNATAFKASGVNFNFTFSISKYF